MRKLVGCSNCLTYTVNGSCSALACTGKRVLFRISRNLKVAAGCYDGNRIEDGGGAG